MALISLGTSTQALFGEGARHELVRLLGIVDGAKLLVVASSSAIRRPRVAKLLDELREVAHVMTWELVRPNPRIADIDACREQSQDQDFTHIVGVGGGSTLDQAKATAMALHCNANMKSLLAWKTPLPKRSNSLVLLPTTSGTGAELSFGAILNDSSSGAKLGLRGPNLAADYAFVDPELTWKTPVGVSMVTGFDVLTHALETWVSTAATPYTRDLSRGAIERVFRWLPVLHDNPDDTKARHELSYASMVMGINLALSTTCLPHRLQYPIGAGTDTEHAAGLAAIYPAWLDQVLPYAEAKLSECAEWIAPVWNLHNSSDRAWAFAQAVKELLRRIELTPSLQDLGVTREMIEHFPFEVEGRLDTDPSFHGLDSITAIYSNAFAAAQSTARF